MVQMKLIVLCINNNIMKQIMHGTDYALSRYSKIYFLDMEKAFDNTNINTLEFVWENIKHLISSKDLTIFI